MKYNKKILLMICGVFLYLSLHFLFKEQYLLNNNFSELNNIELYIELDSSQKNNIDNIIDNINQYGDFVSYSYVDNSKQLFLNNSLKKKTVEQIDVYVDLFKIPSINSLFKTISKLSLSDNLIHSDIVTSFINSLFYLCSNDNGEYEFYDYLIRSLLMENSNNTINDNFHKVIIVSDKTFLKSSDKIKEYLKLYDYIDSIDKYNNIKYVKFYNTLAYDTFVKYQKSSHGSCEPLYNPLSVFYVTTIDSLNDLQYDVSNYLDEISSISILNYLTDKSIPRDKYKKIKNLSIYSSAYSKINDLSVYDFDTLLSSLEDIELNISIKSHINQEYLKKISFIYDYFKKNNNTYKLNQMINNYNMNSPNFIKTIANTELVDLEFVNPMIYSDFYNKKLNKHSLKVNVDKDNYIFYRKFLFKGHNSLFLTTKVSLLNLVFGVISFISLFIILILKRK